MAEVKEQLDRARFLEEEQLDRARFLEGCIPVGLEDGRVVYVRSRMALKVQELEARIVLLEDRLT